MRQPLILHEGGTPYLEHMISRLDSMADETLDFIRHLDELSSWNYSWSTEKKDAVSVHLLAALDSLEDARSAMKIMRKRIAAKRTK